MQRPVLSVAERIVSLIVSLIVTLVTLVTVEVCPTASTVALVVIPENCAQWLSAYVAQENARWFALVVQPLGCLPKEVGQEDGSRADGASQEPLYEGGRSHDRGDINRCAVCVNHSAAC